MPPFEAFTATARPSGETGVSQLDAGDCSVLLQEVADAGQRLYVVVQPNSAIGRADAPFG